MKKLFIITILLLSRILIFSQDTIKIVQYNLLYYGLDNDYCNSSNNDITDKTNYLKTIVSYLKPDIFAVNEIDDRDNVNDYLLGNVFLINGFPNYSRAEILHQYLTDQIFYNNKKLTLKSQDVINSDVRNFNIYKFFYNSPDLHTGDTVFIYYILAHLKAGSDNSDSLDRINEANDIMNYLTLHVPENSNIILSGDFNFYSSYEGAYQVFTNYPDEAYRLYDPGTSGYWHDNSDFTSLHTQSTHYNGNGCASGGGLDDRFDFILYSSAINQNIAKIKFINNSFKTIGQDGNHFNESVDYGTNNSVPANVLTALANNSDHLPISCSFQIDQTPASINVIEKNPSLTKIYSSENNIILEILDNKILGKQITLEIFNNNAQKVYSQNIKTTTNKIIYKIHPNIEKNNIYLIRITSNEKIITRKLFY